MKLKHLATAIAASSLLASTGALAASDGTMGTGAGSTSTGTSVITLTVPDLVKISNMNDITMTHNGVDAFDGTDDVCVYRNITGDYAVQAQSANDPNGAGTGGTYTLSDGGTSEVAYSVDWAGTALDEDVKSAVFAGGADTTQTDCGGVPNVTVTVSATEAEVGAATATGAHTDTLSLIVSAE